MELLSGIVRMTKSRGREPSLVGHVHRLA